MNGLMDKETNGQIIRWIAYQLGEMNEQMDKLSDEWMNGRQIDKETDGHMNDRKKDYQMWK